MKKNLGKELERQRKKLERLQEKAKFKEERLKLQMGNLKKKKKQKPIKTLKKTLDKVFSQWVRNRGAKNGMNQCITCLRWLPVAELQCGHYVSRKHTSTRWDERNCNPQCIGDNVFLHGNIPVYTLRLQEMYGAGIIQELVDKSTKLRKMNRSDYDDLIKKYDLPT